MALDPGDDTIEAEFLPFILPVTLRAFGHLHMELLALCSVEQDLDNLGGELLKGHLQAEPELPGETVHGAAIPGVLVVPECLGDKRPVDDAPALVRDEQIAV